jgi:hypothetical protein
LHLEILFYFSSLFVCSSWFNEGSASSIVSFLEVTIQGASQVEKQGVGLQEDSVSTLGENAGNIASTLDPLELKEGWRL